MRRLVFRAWNPVTGTWLDLNDINLSFIHDRLNPGRWIIVRHEKGVRTEYRGLYIMQFTQLYDDDGNEICEGDVCYAYKTNSGLEGYYTVVWDSRRGRWAYKNGRVHEKYQVGKAGNMHCIIKGNIFDDAELKYIANHEETQRSVLAH